MPALSPAQAITGAGQQMVFSCPASQMVNPATALIFNKSSYELESSSGQLIPAWGIIPYALAAGIGSGVTLILTTVLTPGVVAAPVASVYVQWFLSNETIPDSTDFTAEAIAAAIAGTVSTSANGRVLYQSATSPGYDTIAAGGFFIVPLGAALASDSFLALTIVPHVNMTWTPAQPLTVNFAYGPTATGGIDTTQVVPQSPTSNFQQVAGVPYTYYFPVRGAVALANSGYSLVLANGNAGVAFQATFYVTIEQSELGIDFPSWSIGPVTAVSAPGTLLVPNPPSGFGYRVNTVSVSAISAGTFLAVIGHNSGQQYLGSEVAALIDNGPIWPFDQIVNEALFAETSGAATADFYGSYRLVPIS
jgi:hypothetical protein